MSGIKLKECAKSSWTIYSEGTGRKALDEAGKKKWRVIGQKDEK